jgi:hypothetical protein
MRPRPILVSLLAILVFSSRSPAATPDQIDDALHRAKTFLYSKQKKGNWESRAAGPTTAEVKKSPTGISAGQWGEQTALATYALLAMGEFPQDDKLIPAIKFLQTTKIQGTYAFGAKMQIYPYLPSTPEVRMAASLDLKKLLAAQLASGPGQGLYDTLLDSPASTRVDHGVSLYGVLGVWAAEQAGAEVPMDYWQNVEQAWIRDQDASGAWPPYRTASAKNPLSAAMTAAGLTTLFITQDQLHADNGVLCKGNITDPHIDAGLKWLSDNFDKVLADKQQRYTPFSTLFDVERVGMASGLKYFGSVNWYNVGADYLIKNQDPLGSWGRDIPNACFAILFLSHGRAPVVFNKLQYNIASATTDAAAPAAGGAGGTEGNWNQRPRDAANLVHFVGQETERDLNWQIVNLSAPRAELHDAPILYLAGNQALNFTPDEQSRLKQFCEEGGLILGNADCGSSDFSQSFRKLGTTLFPDYEFRELPPDHPIFTNEQYRRTDWKTPPSILSLSNGVRELMILYPDSDPAKYWQLQEVTGREEFFESADDIFLYAVDKQNLLKKGETYLVTPNPDVTADRRIKLARLQYDGNFDPEPGGWRRLSAILHNTSNVELRVLPIKLGSDKLGSGHGLGAHVAHLTGTTRFRLSDTARAELKRFVEGGGTLIVDAAAGSTDFADSAEAELTTIFGPDTARELKRPLPPSDPLYNMTNGKIDTFAYRSFGEKITGPQHGPQIKAITINDRPAIFFSREDLSAGLVGQPVDGLIGYDPATATSIMRNLILFAALGPNAPVTTQPTDTP